MVTSSINEIDVVIFAKLDGFKTIGIEDGSLYGEAGFTKKPVKIRAVPYAFWNNRGIGEMEVWQNISI